jgi:hypothetical protein
MEAEALNDRVEKAVTAADVWVMIHIKYICESVLCLGKGGSSDVMGGVSGGGVGGVSWHWSEGDVSIWDLCFVYGECTEGVRELDAGCCRCRMAGAGGSNPLRWRLGF